jgi:hypothetical protein
LALRIDIGSLRRIFAIERKHIEGTQLHFMAAFSAFFMQSPSRHVSETQLRNRRSASILERICSTS